MPYAEDPKTPEPDGDEKPGSEPAAKNAASDKAATWARELKASERWMEKFTRSARICERAYMGSEVRDSADSLPQSNAGKVNLFWSNVQVTMAAIYGRMPIAEVDRKFGDFTDDVARVAGMIMQRILNGDIEREYDDTNAAMRDAVQDRFVVGLGQVWCRYEVQTEQEDTPVPDPMTGQPMLDETGAPVTQPTEKILNEDAVTDYVYWADFRYSPARRWRDVRWVARRVYMDADKLKSRFSLSDEQAALVPMMTRTPEEGGFSVPDDVLRATPFKQAAVWEIWDRPSNTVCWYVEGCPWVLEEVDDPLELDDFFPCPQPVTATTLTKAFLPRADYAMAQDLYKELDRLNARLSRLAEACKAAGVYDKNNAAVKSLLTTAVENALVPAESWGAFSEKGGLRGSMDFLPIEQFANTIVQLSQRKAQVERDLYEVLGISDIMRGASVASETLGAQRLKAQYGGARLGVMQNDVARFVAGVMRIRANIVSNFFQPETLLKRSLIERTPDAEYAPQAVQMLKDFGTLMFNVTVTSDSLASPDWDAEKDARTEFMAATSNYLMAAGPMVQQSPELGAFLIKLLQWGAAGFRGSKTIEGVLDQTAKQLEQKAQQPPPPPPPTPEDQKNAAAAQKNAADAQRSAAEAAGKEMENIVFGQQMGLAVPGMAPGLAQQPSGIGAPLPGFSAPMQPSPQLPQQ